jgi:thiamine kinase
MLASTYNWLNRVVYMEFPQFDFEINNLIPQSGGLTNLCIKLETSAGDFLWRPISKQAKLLGADRESEALVLQHLDAQSFAPKLISKTSDGILVQWLPGEMVSIENAQPAAMTLLTKVHHLEMPLLNQLPILRIKQRINDYFEQLTEVNRPALIARYVAHFQTQSDAHLFPISLCHFDIGAHNIVQMERELGLIDWEYACLGDPSLELTITILANQYNCRDAIAYYCQLSQTSVSKMEKAFTHWTPWVLLMQSLWFQLGYQLTHDKQYLTYAKLNLEQLAEQHPLPKL